jgi:hypothetical protein
MNLVRGMTRWAVALAVLFGTLLPFAIITAAPAAAQTYEQCLAQASSDRGRAACYLLPDNPARKVSGASSSSSAPAAGAATGEASSLGVRPGSPDFLPAWRWQNVELDQDQGGILGAVKSMPNSIALILFALANFCWQLLLQITRLGLSADFITPAAPAINAGVEQFSTLAFTFGAVILAIVFYRTVVQGMFRGNLGWPALRDMGTAVLFMALIMGLGNMSGNAADAYNSAKAAGKSAAEIQEQQANFEGTMPWAIRVVTGTVEDFAATLSTGWGLRDRVGDAAIGISEASDPDDRLTCVRYIDELHAQYLGYKGAGEVSTANPTLSGMSRLWESTFYRSWTTAMFSTPAGSTDMGARVMCHYAESTNNISPKEQLAISVAAYDGFPNRDARIFRENSKEEDDRRAITAWAMCKLTSKGFGATAELADSHGNSESSHANDCAKDTGPFGTGQDGLGADNLDVFGNSEALNSSDPEKQLSLASARKWENAWFGQNPAERLLNGFLALAVALGMLWALGFMAIGLVFVQFTLVVLLLLLPLILAAIVITKDQRRDNAVGLLKLIGTSVFTKFFFALIISVLIEIAAVGQAVVDFLPGGGGLFGQVLKGLMPLAALFVVRKVLTRLGMGDILRPTGAVSFASKAAAMTTRNEFAAQVGSAITNRSMQMTGAARALRKADRYAPELDKWNRAGRKARAAEIEAEKQAKLDRRAEEREERGDGPLDRIKDWANTKGWNLDKVDDYAATAAKGAALGVGAIGTGGAILAGGAPALFTAGLYGGKKGNDAFESWQQQRRARSEISAEEGRAMNSVGRIGSVAADADLREHARARQRALQAGESPDAVDQERVLNAYQATLENQYGSEFTEFVNENEAFATRNAFALANGYKPEDVLVGMDGMMMPLPKMNKDRRELTVEQLSHWSHWLDDADKEPRDGEGTEDYMKRLFSIGVSRGLVSSNGRSVDVWSKLGLDMGNANDRRRVEGWLTGDRHDDLLSDTVFQSRNSAAEAAMIKTTLGKGRFNPELEQQREREAAALVQRTLQTVRKDISSRLADGAEGRRQVEDIAGRLAEARSRSDQAAARELAEQLRGEIDRLTHSSFDLAKDLLTSQTDLLVGTGRLKGLDNIEVHLADTMKQHVDVIKAVDESLMAVLNERADASQLLSQLDSLRTHLRTHGAQLVTEADTARKHLDDLHRRGRVDMARIGDATRTSNPIRSLVQHLGSKSFPADKGAVGKRKGA